MKTRKQKTEELRLKKAKRIVDGLLKKGDITFETEFVRLEREPKRSFHKRNLRYRYKLNSEGKQLNRVMSERMYEYFLTLKAKAK